MALVLAMQESRSFYVDDTRVVISEIATPQRVKLTVIGKGMDSSFEVTDRDRVEILPNVYAQVGIGSSPSMVKMVLEAPKQRRILRDSLYEQGSAA